MRLFPDLLPPCGADQIQRAWLLGFITAWRDLLSARMGRLLETIRTQTTEIDSLARFRQVRDAPSSPSGCAEDHAAEKGEERGTATPA